MSLATQPPGTAPGGTRQQRRVMQREARRAFTKRGIPPGDDLLPLFLQTRALLDILENRRNPRRASDAATRAQRGLDLSLRTNPPAQPLACRAGCTTCCGLWVAASAPEVLLLAATLRAAPERATAVAAAAAVIDGLDVAGRAASGQPCGLLAEGLCDRYEARPLACRAYHSFSLEACLAGARDPAARIPMAVPLVRLRSAHGACLRAALRGAGLPEEAYELNQALRVALATDRAEARWLAGEDIFAGVPVDRPSIEILSAELGARLIAGARGV